MPHDTLIRPLLKGWVIPCVTASLAVALTLVQFWPRNQDERDEDQVVASVDTVEPIQPIEVPVGLDENKIRLGRKLFNDPGLSHTGQVSCATCHDLSTGGVDRLPRSVGINGVLGQVNAPTVLNSGLNFSQFWDGRAPTLESQIDGPIQSPVEMGSTWPEVLAKLKSSPSYTQDFSSIYGDEPRMEQVKGAIGEFERSLVTPNSRFDRYLRNQPSAINDRELRGYRLFKSLGCSSCHQGVNVGGNMYQKIGVMASYFKDRGHLTKADLGRYNVTGDPNDKYMFKVPSLRNVELTPPYFHDGSAATLPDAVRMMAKYQLGRRLTDSDVQLITEFLKTLTGKLDDKAL